MIGIYQTIIPLLSFGALLSQFINIPVTENQTNCYRQAAVQAQTYYDFLKQNAVLGVSPGMGDMKMQFLNQFHFLKLLQQTDFTDMRLQSCRILLPVYKSLFGSNAEAVMLHMLLPPKEHAVDMWLRSCHSRSLAALAHPTSPV